MRAMIRAPRSTLWRPMPAFRAVLVNTGATALMRMAGNALAYCTVVMFSAVFDGG